MAHLSDLARVADGAMDALVGTAIPTSANLPPEGAGVNIETIAPDYVMGWLVPQNLGEHHTTPNDRVHPHEVRKRISYHTSPQILSLA